MKETADGRCEEEPSSWGDIFANYLVEDIVTELQKVQPYSVSSDGKTAVSEELNSVFDALAHLIVGRAAIGKRRMRLICEGLLGHSDLYYLSLRHLRPKILGLEETQQYNVFYFLRFLPLPNKKCKAAFFDNHSLPFMNPGVKNSKKVQLLYQNVWLALVKHELPKGVLRQLLPYLSEKALTAVRDGYLFGDFLFRSFKLGDIFAVLSLVGIFKLITEQNFEFPNFYECVYSLTTPSICYLSYREKFFTLLDTFLSSTHLPTYVVAAFVKRLCRLALVAPLACQEPLLALIRNLITRHEGVRSLLHRDQPATVEKDPYDETEKALAKCGALDSSLWELKALQNHWHVEIAKRANFVEKGVQRVESFVRWRKEEDYFAQMMTRKFGRDLMKPSDEDKYLKAQSGNSDDSEEEESDARDGQPAGKRRRIGGRKRRADEPPAVPINFRDPGTDFFSNSFQLRVNDYFVFETTGSS